MLPRLLAVHVLMYGYYLIAALGFSVWWKKYLTMLQLIQFGLAIQQSCWALYNQCNFPRWMMWALVYYAASLMILFLNFYMHSYVMKRIRSNKDGAAVTKKTQ